MNEDYPNDWKPLADRHNTGWRGAQIEGKRAQLNRNTYADWARKLKRRQRIKDVLFALFLIALGVGVLYWIFG